MKMFNKIKIQKNRLILTVSVGVLLSFVLSFGSYTQQLFMNGLFSDSFSLYDTLTPPDCFGLNSKEFFFLDWIKSLFSASLFVLSTICCYIAFQHRNTRLLIIVLSVGVFFSLSIDDTYWYFSKIPGQPPLLESYICNALGAPIVALCICVILLITRKTSELLSIPYQFSNLIFPLLLGTFIFLILFALIKNMFSNTQSTISAFISPPFYGSYSTSQINEKDEKFGVFTNQNIETEKPTWIGQFVNMRLDTEHPTKSAKVSLFLFEGCFKKSTNELLKTLEKPNLLENMVSKISVSVDDGYGGFSVYSRNQDNGYVKASEKKETFFKTELSDHKNKLNLSVFLDKEGSIVHKNWREEAIYRLDLELADAVKIVPRKLSITTDNKVNNYTFTSNELLSIDKANTCKPISNTSGLPHSQSPFLTALFRITYPKVITIQDFNESPSTSIKGLNGWLKVKDINPTTLNNYVDSGELDSISIVGDFDELYIDNEKLEARKSRWLYLHNGISGEIKAGAFHFNGKTEYALLDRQRISKTRWERISTGIKWLLTLIPGAISFLLVLFWKCWINDEELVKL